jgi:hypothetical protein
VWTAHRLQLRAALVDAAHRAADRYSPSALPIGHPVAQVAPSDASRSGLDAAEALLRVTQRIVGSDLVAVILHGSLASDDFVANKSDVDLLVVVHNALEDMDKQALAEAVTTFGRVRRVRLDYRVVTSGAALQPRRTPILDFYVGMHPTVPNGVQIEHGPACEPDLLFEFAICRQEGRSLTGPAPSDLIGAVPDDWLLDVGDGYLKRWQETDFDERTAELMVLTACRLWYRSAEHRHCTKTAAAEWVMRQSPELRAPKLALEARRTDANPVIPEADVMALLAKVRNVLARRH